MTNTFQDWLRLEIEKSGLSYSKIGQRGGFSHARISQVLSGEKPGAAFCVALAYALDIPTNEVLRRAEFPTVLDAPVDDDPQKAELKRLIQQVPTDARVWVVRMLRGICE